MANDRVGSSSCSSPSSPSPSSLSVSAYVLFALESTGNGAPNAWLQIHPVGNSFPQFFSTCARPTPRTFFPPCVTEYVARDAVEVARDAGETPFRLPLTSGNDVLEGAR